MADIRPFKAIRPVDGYAGAVAAMPYDTMSDDEARVMVKDNPLSFLHVEKAEIDAADGEDIYGLALRNLTKLRGKGVLIQDSSAKFYIYRLGIGAQTQTGLVACVSVSEYMENKIIRHELTRSDKELDRTEHIDACNANTGPIMIAYHGREAIDNIIEGVIAAKKPVYEFTADDGVTHTCWVVDGESELDALRREFYEVPKMYIADGHHRFAAASNLAKKRGADGYDKDAEYNFCLAVLFSEKDLKILPYNRICKDLNGYLPSEFLDEVSKKFRVTETDAENCAPAEARHFGMYLDGKWYMLDGSGINEFADTVSALDVSILQNEILSPILGITDVRTNKRIEFYGGTRGINEIMEKSENGVAFVMYPTQISELFAVSDAGLLMPPKSTWFAPKLLSGLFVHEF